MVDRKRIYIAGPITKGNLLQNVRQADDMFLRLVRAGFTPLNPMWSVYAGGARMVGWPGDTDEDQCEAVGLKNSSLPLTHADWIGLDLPWVAASDAVLRLPGDSRGADAEVEHARRLGILVVFSVEELLIAYPSQR